MRFAESEVLLRGGKRKEHEHPSNGVEEVHQNNKKQRVAAPAVVDGIRPHGVASTDKQEEDSEPNISIKTRKAVLIARGWRSKRGYEHREHWLSPVRKLEFVTTKAAEKFEDACQACMGDEDKAFILFTKVQRQGHSRMRDVIGGASAITSKLRAASKTTVKNTSDRGELADNVLELNVSSKALRSGQLPKKVISNEIRDSENLLFSNGWTKVVASRQRIKRYFWVSPKLNLHFKNRIEATLFDSICQENNGDEVFSLSTYTEKIKQSGSYISAFILGGESVTERKAQDRRFITRQPMPKTLSSNRRIISFITSRFNEGSGTGAVPNSVRCVWYLFYRECFLFSFIFIHVVPSLVPISLLHCPLCPVESRWNLPQ
jgi:hypothetical protein